MSDLETPSKMEAQASGVATSASHPVEPSPPTLASMVTTAEPRAQQPKERGDSRDSFLDNVDLSRMDDIERMQQREYDDAVVELALYNYAWYHRLEPEKVTFAHVCATSAGIEGWACLGDGGGGTMDPIAAAPPPPIHQVKSDEKEVLQFQAALLESVGARPSATLPQMGAAVPNLFASEATTTYEYDEENDDDDS